MDTTPTLKMRLKVTNLAQTPNGVQVTLTGSQLVADKNLEIFIKDREQIDDFRIGRSFDVDLTGRAF